MILTVLRLRYCPFVATNKPLSALSCLTADFIISTCELVNGLNPIVEEKEPADVGVDIVVGSLIKNAGGGLAPTGAYIVGTKKAVELIEKRLTCPSLGGETGSYEQGYRLFFQGLFLAPHITMQAIKGAYLVGEVMNSRGYDIIPKSKLFRYYANILLFPICLIAVILFDVFQLSDTFGRTVVTLYFLVSAIPFAIISPFDDKE